MLLMISTSWGKKQKQKRMGPWYRGEMIREQLHGGDRIYLRPSWLLGADHG